MRTYSLLLLFTFAIAGTAEAGSLESRRSDFRSALAQAERGPGLSPTVRRSLLDHPLYPYIEYAELRRDIGKASAEDVDALLARHADMPFAPVLRDQWLHELARRKDWSRFRQLVDDPADTELRCHHLQARLAAGRDPALLDDIAAMWLHGSSLPKACDPAFAALQAAGRIDPALRWQRIMLAAEANNPSLIRYLARGLPAPQQAQADAYAAFLASPSRQAQSWPRNQRSQQIAVLGLQRLARRDTAQAEALLAALASPLGMDAGQRGDVLNQIALWSAASYEPESARRFAVVPAAQFDRRLHEWRAREALARSDHAGALAAIEAMPDELRRDPRWRYLEARMRELQGDAEVAGRLLASLALEPNYFGFLAADRTDAPYALCPIEPSDDREMRTTVQDRPGFQRALELHALDRVQWATREWNALLPSLSDDERRVAVALAVDAGWTDRAVFSLAKGDDQRVYSVRFPLAHARHLREEAARHGLDPAWVAALIRAESAWQPGARSHANARGLMQLLPGTGADVARRQGMRWQGPSSLYQPRTNISLGTAHLAELLERFGSDVYRVTAAYNAGPTPVARWISERPTMPADLWIETIPYYETREYVSRILAFSVIYDWRFGGRAVPISERAQGRTGPTLATRSFVCPVPATADNATATTTIASQ